MANAPAAPLLTPEETALVEFDTQQRGQQLTDTLTRYRRAVTRTRTKTGKLRSAKFLAEVIALRTEGIGPTETAKVLGVSESKVYRALRIAREHVTADAMLDQIDKEILPLAVDNLANGVIRGDKDYTLEALRGRGLFRTHKSIDAQVKQTILTLQVNVTEPEHLAGRDMPMPRMGAVVGAPVAAVGNAHMPPPKVPARVTVETPAGQTLAVLKDPDDAD